MLHFPVICPGSPTMASHLASAPTEILVLSELTLTEISTYYTYTFLLWFLL